VGVDVGKGLSLGLSILKINAFSKVSQLSPVIYDSLRIPSVFLVLQ
jgi:hypothetical protein